MMRKPTHARKEGSRQLRVGRVFVSGNLPSEIYKDLAWLSENSQPHISLQDMFDAAVKNYIESIRVGEIDIGLKGKKLQ